MILRHHFEPLDPAFGRHVAHDDRSFDFPAPRAALGAVRWRRLVRAFNQRHLGSCTGNAGAGVVSTEPFARRCTESDAVSLYGQATHLDSIRGVYPPTDTGSSGLAVMKALKARGWIESYTHAFGLEHALEALMVGPGITGITWLDGCDTPDAEGIVRYTGAVRGGHEIELSEYDPVRGLVWFWNSWGESFGLGGRFAMSAEDYGRALDDHGDATYPKAA